jgi:hypothetical protein
VVSTRRGTPTLPSWCQGLSWQHFSRPMDRTQRICWVPPTIARFNPTWLLLVGLLDGRGIQHKASNTSKAPTRTWKGLAQPSQQHLWWPLVSQLLTAANCARKVMVVILNTYTRFANSLSANADVCNGLVY